MKALITQEKAAESAAIVGLPRKRVRVLVNKAKIAQFMQQVGMTEIGQGDLEVANEVLESVLIEVNRMLKAVKKTGNTEEILRVLTRKHAIADSMTRIAEIRMRTHEAAKVEAPKNTTNIFPAGVAIGINIAPKEEPPAVKVLELPPAPVESAS